jgi:hypothetical protein|uniref:Uncharacterized protein n=1 Tax=Picea glauca TaxID=3330 RepID=A0A101LZH3_PICGL|nr:hypothetical protein ABT39_MTgene5218 [Picea glauca]
MNTQPCLTTIGLQTGMQYLTLQHPLNTHFYAGFEPTNPTLPTLTDKHTLHKDNGLDFSLS